MRMITLGLFGVTLAVALAAGCGDDDDDAQLTGGSAGASGTGGGAGTGGAGGGAAGTGGRGGAGGQPIGAVTVLATFDPAVGELPEGLAVAGDGTPYVGFAPKGEIVRLRADGSGRAAYARVPAPPPDGQGFMTGLALDAQSNLYAALVSFKADVVAPGVYRVATGRDGAGGAGGAGGVLAENTPWATNPSMVFPNGFAIDDKAKVGYVTDSSVGAIYRFSLESAGAATEWLKSDLLAGDPLACGGKAEDLSIGANGLVKAGNTFFVANSNKGTIVRVAVDAQGVPEAPTEFVNDCAQLKGADGITPDGTGGLYVAVNAQNKIVRVDRDGAITTLAQGGELDFPASLVAQGNALYVTNFALTSPAGAQKAALLRVEVQSRQGREAAP
ncbi:MAG TPA: SMP-30/gluconolactonase/LRE family protein [Polyangiaceae bacterium]|nr:SMP-30/gluconolactonase/LRE family protein [Polyangiaceae bacterium]